MKPTIHPAEVLSTGVAWGVGTQRVANVVAPIVIGAVLANTNFLQAVSMITLFLVVTLLAAFFYQKQKGMCLGSIKVVNPRITHSQADKTHS